MSDKTIDDPLEQYDEEWFAQRGIDDERVISALEDVPREHFLKVDGDEGLPAKTLPPVEVVGKLLTALQIDAEDSILEVGTETGYITALLAELGDTVCTVERRARMGKLAEGRLEELDIDNVEVLYGPQLTEYAANAPYEAIILSAVAPRVPEKLKQRLALGGRMVVPIAEGDENPEVIAIRRDDEHQFERKSLGQLRFSSKLGDILVELGVADRTDVELAALEADAHGKRIGETILEHTHVEERDLVRALAIQRGCRTAPADKLLEMADHELAYSVPRAFLEHHQTVPLDVDNDTLKVATVDPDTPAVELAQIVGAESIETYLVTRQEFQRIWDTILEGRRSRDTDDGLKSRVESKFEKILRSATRLGARQFHVENQSEGARVRFRVDGDLRPIPEMAFTPTEVNYLVEFLKIQADLEVLEERIPQRGRFSWVRNSTTYNLHIHVMPSIDGEQLSVRLLSEGNEPPTLEELHFPRDVVDDMQVLLRRLKGLFLVVGPRHSGKRNTLNALLAMFAEDETQKVGVVETDIRCPIPGAQQVMIEPDRDFGYTEAIREFVRFDVDVLGIDEIPNPEVAMAALSAARRGPSLLATLHGNDADYVVAGLQEFGVPGEALANGISGILSQRTAPLICKHCRVSTTLTKKRCDELFDGNDPPPGFKAFRGTGCEHCDQTGTNGEVPIVALSPFGNSLREAILSNDSDQTLQQIARDTGINTLGDYAVDLVKKGKIPVDELMNYDLSDR